MKLSWIYYLFVAIPESLALTLFALSSLKLPLNRGNILKVSILYGTSAFIVRNLPISFGIHIIVLIAVFASLLVIFTKCKVIPAFLIGLINMVILGIAEIITGPLLMQLLNVTYQEVQSNDWLLVIFVLPQVILFITLAFFIRRYHFTRGKSDETSL